MLAIDESPERIEAIADLVDEAVVGDATNEQLLRAAGVGDYDCAMICITSVNENLLLAIMLRELGVKWVAARAINAGHKKVLERIGVDEIVFPEQDTGERLGFLLARDRVTDFIEFAGHQIAEIHVPQKWIGRTLVDLQIRTRYGANVVAVRNAAEEVGDVTPDPMRPFAEGDLVTLFGTAASISKLI